VGWAKQLAAHHSGSMRFIVFSTSYELAPLYAFSIGYASLSEPGISQHSGYVYGFLCLLRSAKLAYGFGRIIYGYNASHK
jgi:hypothetical protein